MSEVRSTRIDNLLLRRLAENDDESAAAALFMQLYRKSPELRHWLREDYARDKKLQRKFDAVAMRKVQHVTRFAELTDDNASWRKEQRTLKEKLSRHLYGGLTWNEVTEKIQHYQAGTLDLGIFLLVQEWQKTDVVSPSLMWGGLAFLELVLPSGRRRLLKHLNAALAFAKQYEKKKSRRALVGYSDWWKLNALIYVLRNPRYSYAVRDLRGHLTAHGITVSVKDIQRFCIRHNLRRDTRSGRPRRASAS